MKELITFVFITLSGGEYTPHVYHSEIGCDTAQGAAFRSGNFDKVSECERYVVEYGQ